MGYPCPVCDSVHHDAEHLANHLAVTAMLGSDEHEAWLDDHAPDWGDATPRELGALVTDHVEEESTPAFDEGDHDHRTDEPRGGDLFADEPTLAQQPRGGGAATGADVGDIMEEAREMTERMLGRDGDERDDGEEGENRDE